MSRLPTGREGHPFRYRAKNNDDDNSTSNGIAMSPQNSVDGTEQQRDESCTMTELEPNLAFNFEVKSSGNEPTPQNGGLVLGGGRAIKLMLVPDNAPTPAPPPKKKEKPHPQTKMTKFWANFDPEYVGKVTRVLPDRMTDRNLSLAQLVGETAHRASNSYDNAKETCIRDVKRIIKECRDANQKYTDSHFDIERDLKITRGRDCLDGLVVDPNDKEYPADVKRVTDIYDEPKFYVDGVSYDDILQGSVGDCWFLAAISSLGCNQQFIDRVCVIQDQAVGVYGFVFHRDGDWHHCIIDDKLFLRAPNYDESGDVVLGQYGVRRSNQEDQYQELFQRGSQALYFAQCRDQNETWVSLLEKAYAKAHGDYASISGGQTGEAIEDLTGGVTTEIYTTNILDTEAFWKNELSRIGKDFVFSCAAARWREWRPYLVVNERVREERRSGIVSQHAYAVLGTYEGHGQRLVKIRNSWGRKEWTGAWSDGSKEWDADWLKRLEHQFGDDGFFFMTYKDMLSKFKYIDRTRIFGPDWQVAQQWMSVQVPWSTLDYQTNYFSIDVPEDTEAVIVLSQLDDRYFKGLQGQYNYTLQFRVQKDSDHEEEYIARSKLNYELVRSVNVEVHLAKGTYSVLVKVEAVSTGREDVEKVIRDNIHRRDKITQIGKLYDLAHQKGQLPRMSSPGPSGTSTPSAVGACTPPAPASIDQGSTDFRDGNGKDDNSEDPERDPNRNPWNASCVVGLRVYSKQPDLGLKVVVPTKDEIVENKPTLDRDDVAKSALDEVQVLADKVDEITGSVKGDDDDDENEGVRPTETRNDARDLTAPGKKRTQQPIESDEDEDDSDDESAASHND
ncbi:hypothetical protein LTR10_014723 [Elasticomyces elasticus]|uniref:Calpain catalytic domain-containing protein n=1 Tax=Exophiala sideris TaxID=1016849 RepID=A0ABR0J771_9EURO|nr:hypothetical protein LTR10_014723 [Elasticomyces elasticus]KAK5029368.1 hypothetical protein LTS07_005830 [Exophiala sideris]KAK5036934.1 hypothetical protein LTR13_005314 [Exophiala sideris]KAK5057998.1 hypothetical protein LTR69_006995 [Exophiala sideris]KAK5181957.1 hypothetical protein LTR44_005558 [Eurotiomycetes sp. CCFEE 6388]